MLSEEEIAELAEDIKVNGLRSPLVIDIIHGEPWLVDGRNRRAACKLAGVEPTTVNLEGDALAYIVSANINRRHLTASQRTMIVAKIYPIGVKGKKSSLPSKQVNSGELAKARLVLKFLPELAERVVAGIEMLNAAYEEAKMAQERSGSADSEMARIKERAPELIEVIVAGKMTISQAAAAMRQKEQDDRRKEEARISGRNVFLKAMMDAAQYASRRVDVQAAAEFLKSEADKVKVGDHDPAEIRKAIRAMAKTLTEEF